VTTTTIVQNKNGTTTTTTKKVSLSALSVGADFQALLITQDLPFTENYFYVSPYYQTDYRGLAQVAGADIAWEPVVDRLVNSGIVDENFSYVTQFRADATISHVYNSGLTQLTQGQHAWIGETARPNLTLFPLVPSSDKDPDWISEWIRGRISLIGTQQFYWDADTGKTAAYYQAKLAYKLGACTVATTAPKGTPCAFGSSAISLTYSWGRAQDTYVKANQILATLSYSY
jgi:hypothetical protein